MTNKRMAKLLQQHRDRLAKVRDDLRDFKDELDALEDAQTRAIDDLDNAIWTLSEQV